MCRKSNFILCRIWIRGSDLAPIPPFQTLFLLISIPTLVISPFIASKLMKNISLAVSEQILSEQTRKDPYIRLLPESTYFLPKRVIGRS